MSEHVAIPSAQLLQTITDKNNLIKRNQFISVFCNTYLAKLLFVYNKPETINSYPLIRSFVHRGQQQYKISIDLTSLISTSKALKIVNINEIDINLKDLSISIAKAGGWYVRYYARERPIFDVYTFDPDNCGQWYEVTQQVNQVDDASAINWDDALRPLDNAEQNVMARLATQNANMRRFAEQMRQEAVFYRPPGNR